MVERFISNEEVVGSIPAEGSRNSTVAVHLTCNEKVVGSNPAFGTSSYGPVVKTSALHAEDRRFNPCYEHFFNVFNIFY